ncbi:MAG: hypothetical protein QOJ07_942 [Thermoleophilaceae bacterium]|nr:hypothetical protein [Thermoleophilaceae bacterium]
MAPETRAKCPRCGSDVDRDQPFCLECGRRIALSYRRPPNWRIPLALVALLVIAAGVAAGFAVTQATSTHDKAPDAITVTDPPTPGSPPPAAAPAPAPPAAPAAPAAAVPTWPAGKNAYTVVLLTTQDKDTANATAAKATTGGTPAGVLRADDYRDFGPGLYVVFAGQYDTAGAARAQAKKLATAHAGAYARRIEPAPKP